MTQAPCIQNACEPGFQCVADLCWAESCVSGGEVCSDNGVCAGEPPKCACVDNFAGSLCAECAAGYQLRGYTCVVRGFTAIIVVASILGVALVAALGAAIFCYYKRVSRMVVPKRVHDAPAEDLVYV